MSDNSSMTGSAHPAPHRERAPFGALAFGLIAAPIGWALHLLVNYGIAGQHCGSAALAAATSDDTLSTIFLIDLMAIVLALTGGYVAFELWKKTWQEKEGTRIGSSNQGKGAHGS